MKCEHCGKSLKEFSEDYMYCNNPDCVLDDKGWDKLSVKEPKKKEE